MRLLGWIGWAGLEALSRLVLLSGSTIIFSMMLVPRDFGLTALVLIVVTVAALFVGSPFEETLAQRRDLRRQHVETALATALAAGVVLLLLSVPVAFALAALFNEPQFAALMPVAMVSIFATGRADIMKGLARRQRKFNDMAVASIVGHTVGIALSVALAIVGFGLWALIAQRLLVTSITALSLDRRLRTPARPRFSLPHFMDMKHFASMSLFARLSDNLNLLAFNYVVGALYGMTSLGYANLAMRIIEPIRGALTSVSHNLAFFYFAAVQHRRHELRERIETVLSRAALLVAPAFVGLAAIMPVLLPLIVGPGWEQSIDIAVCLAIGGAILLPVRPIYTALTAASHPGFNLIANFAALVATTGSLLLGAGLGPIAVGLSRLAGDVVQAVIAIGLSPRHLDWPRADRFLALLPAWLLSAVMAGAVIAFGALAPPLDRRLELVLSVLIGISAYALAVGLFARRRMLEVLSLIRLRHAET